MMNELQLGVPKSTWHTARDRWAELISNFALIASTFAKIANEVGILMRSEVGELSEPFEVGRGASTTLPKTQSYFLRTIIAIAPSSRTFKYAIYSYDSRT